MKLYYSPGACSLAVRIALLETGLPFEIAGINRQTRKTSDGDDYSMINAKGSVPALKLDNGQVLTEAAVILQYVADQKPEAKLIPPPGQFERYRLQEWLNFIATDLHKNYTPLFNPAITPDWREWAEKNLTRRYDWVEKQLPGRTFLTGDTFTVADIYFFTVTRWAPRLRFDLGPWPQVQQLMRRLSERPKIHEALVAEGLTS